LTGGFWGEIRADTSSLQSAGAEDVFIINLSPSLGVVSLGRFGGPGDDDGSAIETDPAGDLVVAGDVSSAVDFGCGPIAPGSATFVVSLDPMGDCRWSHGYGRMLMTAVDGTPAGGAIVGGTFGGPFGGAIDFGNGPVMTMGNRAGFVLSLDASGAYRWANTYGGAPTGAGFVSSVAVDAWGEVVAGGEVAGTAQLGGGLGNTGGEPDGFVVKLAPTGAYLWSTFLAGSGAGIVTNVAVDPAGNIAGAGLFAGGEQLGSTAVQAALVFELTP
jgi:hypothetical protein